MPINAYYSFLVKEVTMPQGKKKLLYSRVNLLS